MQNIWTPAIRLIIQTREGQPVVGSSQIIVLITINAIKINAIRQNKNPIIDAMAKGAVENATIPSSE